MSTMTAAGQEYGTLAGRERTSRGLWAVGSPLQLVVGVGVGMLYLLALGIGQDQLATGVIGLGAILAIIAPASGLAMFVLIMPMREPDLLVPVRFNAILAGAITLGCILRLPIDRPALRLHPALVLLVGYLVYSAISIVPFLSGHPQEWTPSALNLLLRLSTGVALFLSALYLFRLTSPWPYLWIGLAGATLTALLAIGQILGVLPFEPLIGGLLEPTGGLRAGGAFADPNFLGLYMATATVFGLGVLGLVPRSAWVVLVPVVIILFLGTALAYSRGGALGLIAGVILLVTLRNKFAGLVLLIVAGILVVTLYPIFLEARQGAVLTPMDFFNLTINEDTRLSMAKAALAMFAAYPLFGVGFGVFQYVSPSYVVGGAPDSSFAHNQYLNVLAEQGIVGAIMVVILLVTVTVVLARSHSPLRNTALAMGATYLVVSVFLHTATVFQSSSIIWLVLAATLAFRPALAGDERPT